MLSETVSVLWSW